MGLTFGHKKQKIIFSFEICLYLHEILVEYNSFNRGAG